MLTVGLGGMNDEEYKAHFSMWAAIKSPLLIGADLRKLSPDILTILNNPAVLVVNQDPLGRSVKRIKRDLDVQKDQYGEGETHVWSGELFGGDQCVVFFNAADEDVEMTASLKEIFVHEGPGGSAPQVKASWDYYDLWANRMDTDVAAEILEAPVDKLEPLFKEIDWYNATTLPYSEGLKQKDIRLMGVKVGVVGAGGSITVTVPRHSVKMFRLRSTGSEFRRYSTAREEL